MDESHNNIRQRPIPWEGYIRANILSVEDGTMIKALEKLSSEKKLTVIKKSEDKYSSVFIKLLDSISRDDVRKYLLCSLADLVEEDKEFGQVVLKNNEGNLWQVFLKCLDTDNEVQLTLTIKNIVLFLILTPKSETAVVSTLIDTIDKKLASKNDLNLQEFSIQAYVLLFKHNKTYRQLFDKNPAYSNTLITILKGSSSNLQLQYTTLLVVWLLSFTIVPIPLNDLVPLFFDIIKVSVKEKIVRISISTLVNLSDRNSRVLEIMLVNDGLTLINTLNDRKWSDEELIEDLSTLKTRLNDLEAKLSTIDHYLLEINSNNLSWSPVHESEFFWTENKDAFKDKDWSLLKKLTSLLLNNENDADESNAIILNDIYNIINQLPESIIVLTKIPGVKLKIMELMQSSNSKVKFNALKTTQVFISNTFS